MRSSRWLLVASVALAVVGAACSEDVSDFRPQLKHKDTTDHDDDTARTPVVDAGVQVAPVVDAAPAAVDAAIGTPICNAGGVALCFAFDNSASDGSTNGLAATTTGVTFVPGRNGYAASFTATSTMRFAPNAIFDLPAGGATIEAWIKRQSTGADAVVFDDDGRFSLTISAANKVLCKSSGGAVTGATDVPDGAWAHVACVIDAGTMKAYIAGVEDGAGTGSIAPNPTLAAALGGNSPDGEPFVGLIDSFRLFSVARTPAEIATDAQ